MVEKIVALCNTLRLQAAAGVLAQPGKQWELKKRNFFTSIAVTKKWFIKHLTNSGPRRGTIKLGKVLY